MRVAEPVATIHREEPAAVMGQFAQPPVDDELAGVLDERRPAVVVSAAGDHAGAATRQLDRGRRLGIDADRLLARDVLPRRRRRLDDLAVEGVRRRDIDDVNVVAGDQLAPVEVARGEPEVVAREVEPLRDVVGDRDQPRPDPVSGK